MSAQDLCLLLAPLHPFTGRERGGYRGLFAEGATLGTLICSQLLGPTLKTEENKMTSFPLGLVPGKSVVRLDGTMVPSEECGRSPVTPHETSDDTGPPLHQDSGLEPKECAAAPLRGALNPA